MEASSSKNNKYHWLQIVLHLAHLCEWHLAKASSCLQRGHNDHFYGNIWLKLDKNRPKDTYIRLPVVSIMKLKATLVVSASIFSLLIAFGKEIKDAT